MKSRRNMVAATGTLLLALALGSTSALAQSRYPNKTIRWVVPSPPGSPIDAIARKLGEAVGKDLGQVIVIDNKAGAVGTIGAGDVARAPADGYTFLFCVSDPLIAALAVLKSLPYDPRKDFVFISKAAVGAGPVLVANPRVKANTLTEFVAGIKSGGVAPSYGSWGPGTIPMQIMESLARQAGGKVLEVPYRGSPPALQDTLAGLVDMTFLAPFVAAPLVAEGKLKALGVIGAQRISQFPKVQTFKEAGFASFVFTNPIWVGLVGPAGMPVDVQQRMADAVHAGVHSVEVRKFLGEIGFDPIGNTPTEFEREYRTEVEIIPKLIRDLGLVPQ